MRVRLPWQYTRKVGRRRLTPDERLWMVEREQDERMCFDTPAIIDFLVREDVVELQAPSGWYHLWTPEGHFDGELLGEVVTRAMKEAL